MVGREESLEMLLKYPLIECNAADTWHGTVTTTNSTDVDIKLHRHSDKQFSVQLNTESVIKHLSIHSDRPVEALDSVSDQLPDFTDSYTDIESIRHLLRDYHELCNVYRFILRGCMLKLREGKLRFGLCDEAGRIHQQEVGVSFQPNSSGAPYTLLPVEGYSLPEALNVGGYGAPCTLLTLFQRYRQLVDELQIFFDVMDALDSNCVVLAPENPSRADDYRRIYMGHNVSIVLTVKPLSVLDHPDIRFLGPERKVISLRSAFSANLDQWAPQAAYQFVPALLQLLGLEEFPTNREARDDNNAMDENWVASSQLHAEILHASYECCICFALRTDNQLPDIICSNACCEKAFHSNCLFQWLISINAKCAFNQLTGPCPNCEKDISCPAQS